KMKVNKTELNSMLWDFLQDYMKNSNSSSFTSNPESDSPETYSFCYVLVIVGFFAIAVCSVMVSNVFLNKDRAAEESFKKYLEFRKIQNKSKKYFLFPLLDN
uniref:Uncharacterized protein n=1 Tax=Latimeria chalumnae TaxID=7897 RepID=H3B2M1_LATCH